MAKTYYVVGGEYADTSFTKLAPGAEEERFGPFEEHDAHECWRALTGKTVDNAMVRYFIRSEDDAGGRNWYVVGGEYADTSFTRIADGHEIEIRGPFTRAEALQEWRAVTGRTVDSALTRYELATEEEVNLRRREGA